MNRFIPLLALFALPACSGYEEDTEPVGAVTQSEAEALDDAAEMIEQRRLPEGVVPPAPEAVSHPHLTLPTTPYDQSPVALVT